MPARTLNDFFAGFFCQHECWEVRTRIPLDRGKGDVKVVKIEGKRGKEKEVIIHRGIFSSIWKRWSHESFSRTWSKKYSV
jgi:hypothetical protein